MRRRDFLTKVTIAGAAIGMRDARSKPPAGTADAPAQKWRG